ncbi:MAG: hypothetical protein J5814_00250, partial [Bacteroidaceae bacterium]|nr:hypothetical protein [Bacteroidaceae bacterium]
MKSVCFSEHCSSLPYRTASLMRAWRCLAVRDILRPGGDGNEPLSCRGLRKGVGAGLVDFVDGACLRVAHV